MYQSCLKMYQSCLKTKKNGIFYFDIWIPS